MARITDEEFTCKDCGITYPNTDEYARNKNDGYRSARCHACDPKSSKKARDHLLSLADGPRVDIVIAKTHERDIARANELELKKNLAQEARMRRYLDVLSGTLTSYDPTPLLRPPQADEELPYHEWILVLSDWHTGQKTLIEETGSLYSQDVETTRSQVERVWHELQLIHSIESAGRRIPKLHILGLGDFIDGDDMRPSQHRKVEDVWTVQTVQAFDLVVWLVRQALQIFESVEIDFVGGNHDRISRRAGDAHLGEQAYTDTAAFLLGEFAKRVLASDISEGRLRIHNWKTFFGYKEILGQRIAFEHGASIKWSQGSYGGVPWYGIAQLKPRYASMMGDVDMVFLGHGHKAAILSDADGWVIVNGALPATSTFVQSSFKTIQRPQQWLISLHEKIGVTSHSPLYADAPGTLKRGEVWRDPEYYASLAST